MFKINIIFFLFLLVSLNGFPENILNAQTTEIRQMLVIPDTSQIQILKTKEGSTFIGRIVNVRQEEIDFLTDIGTLKIQINKITSIRVLSKNRMKQGNPWFENPNTTRMFFAPTGRMLKKGHGYFSDYYIFFPGVAYGVTDNFTIGGGASLFPGVSLDEQFFYFTPKMGISASEKSNFAVGALILVVPEFMDEGAAGILYGVWTYGLPDLSLSLGMGFGFAGDNFSEKPMVTIGIEKRLSQRTAFVSENWVLPGIDQPLISYGVRFMGESMAIDLALATPLGNDFIFPGVPMIDFIFNFE